MQPRHGATFANPERAEPHRFQPEDVDPAGLRLGWTALFGKSRYARDLPGLHHFLLINRDISSTRVQSRWVFDTILQCNDKPRWRFK
jgi:hypothetical protein